MPARRIARPPQSPVGLTRRSALLLPLLLAACGGEETQDFPPLTYGDLPPIRLNVASIGIEQHFIPSGMRPDVTQLDPVSPTDALKAMANQRLRAFGSAGRAVFVIQDASLVKQGDTITGTMDVLLNVYPSDDAPRAGFAEAHVTRQYSGDLDDLRARLYDMTKAMMQAMNVEFEFQVSNRLHDWMVSGSATLPPVQAQPLNAAPPASSMQPPPPPGAPPPYSPPPTQPPAYSAPPPGGAPTTLAPTTLAPPDLPPPLPMPPAGTLSPR